MRSGYIKDIAGQRFGSLTAVSFSHLDKHKKAYWKTKCDCGRDHTASTGNLRSGQVKTCGCRMSNFTPRDEPLFDRLMAGITMEPNTGCWLWMNNCSDEFYGKIRYGAKTSLLAHRVAYEIFVGPIPNGLVLDHKCCVTLCCNPQHLRPMTIWENAALGDPHKYLRERASCHNGHPFTEETIMRTERGGRRCLICYQNRYARKAANSRARYHSLKAMRRLLP